MGDGIIINVDGAFIAQSGAAAVGLTVKYSMVRHPSPRRKHKCPRAWKESGCLASTVEAACPRHGP